MHLVRQLADEGIHVHRHKFAQTLSSAYICFVFLKRFISFLLAIWVFVSSTGLALNLHFCGDMLRKAALSDVSDACPMHQEPIENPKACCSSSTEPVVEVKQEVISCHAPLPTEEKEDCCSNVALEMDFEFDASISKSLHEFCAQEQLLSYCLAQQVNHLASLSYLNLSVQDIDNSPPSCQEASSHPFLRSSLDLPLLVQSFLL